MGSRGGGSYFTARDLETLREEAKRRLEQSQADADVNSFLQQQLAAINERDVDKINSYLEQVEAALKQEIEEVERLLFGGSVAKHTYVDGLSDVDSLVVLSDPSLFDRKPEEVRDDLRRALLQHLPQNAIRTIRAGNMAVTIEYRDGTEIQLLPAVRSGDKIAISSADGKSWTSIEPREFARKLTSVNKNQGGAVIPAIKLAKPILANRLGANPPSGYHVEALAVAAFQDYKGPRSPKAMLVRLFDTAAQNVLRPMVDVTGQSSHVDDYLGTANSPARRGLAQTLRQIAKEVSAGSTKDWQTLFE